MPKTASGKKAMKKFKKQYGGKEGEKIYYATANKQGRDEKSFKKEESMRLIDDLMIEHNGNMISIPKGTVIRENKEDEDEENLSRFINKRSGAPNGFRGPYLVLFYGAKNAYKDEEESYEYPDSIAIEVLTKPIVALLEKIKNSKSKILIYSHNSGDGEEIDSYIEDYGYDPFDTEYETILNEREAIDKITSWITTYGIE